MTHLAEVKTLYETNCRSVPDMMREAAASIEGETDDHERTVAMIAVQVLENGDVQVYGWGDTTDIHAVGSLQMGVHRLLTDRYGGDEWTRLTGLMACLWHGKSQWG